ncbi:hypothetical protein LOK74_02005 [Brevibacillus humidisoli]|uniref:hypothetical protein n=1 Tax=Brevibacillus humidisoli TaxID=2895522 RepID=UPI001E52B0F3|nr:hypothetical protein [Brevibacillus humidisoli]UFJ41334.1 hypothetical protein LOK74_02005 [Brevibacillus humidisoli]
MGKAINWIAVKSVLKGERGGPLIENKLLLVVSVIAIFGITAIVYPFIQEYTQNRLETIEEKSTIDTSVEW